MKYPRADRVRLPAAGTWCAIALAVGTGCIPIYVPSIEQDITTGDRLHAIEAARIEKPTALTKRPPPVPGQPADWRDPPRTPCVYAELDAVRAQLLATPPSMGARIETWHDAPASDYSGWDPGLFEPVDRERRDLERARDAGILTSAEFAELSALLDDQARRQIVRHGWELTSERATWNSTFSHFFGSSFQARTPEARQERARGWVVMNVERLRKAGDGYWPSDSVDPSSWLRGGDIWLVPSLLAPPAPR